MIIKYPSVPGRAVTDLSPPSCRMDLKFGLVVSALPGDLLLQAKSQA